MKIIFIFVKQQSKRSSKSAAINYDIYCLLSIILHKKIMRVTTKHINASEWYRPQQHYSPLQWKAACYFSFLQWHDPKRHCQFLLFFIRTKKIQAFVLIMSQTDDKIVLVILLETHQLLSAMATLCSFSSSWMFCCLKYYQHSKPSPKQPHAQHSVQAEFYLKRDTRISYVVDTGCGGAQQGSWCIRSSLLLL